MTCFCLQEAVSLGELPASSGKRPEMATVGSWIRTLKADLLPPQCNSPRRRCLVPVPFWIVFSCLTIQIVRRFSLIYRKTSASLKSSFYNCIKWEFCLGIFCWKINMPSSFLFKKYLFYSAGSQLRHKESSIFAVKCRIFTCSIGTLSCSRWDLVLLKP